MQARVARFGTDAGLPCAKKWHGKHDVPTVFKQCHAVALPMPLLAPMAMAILFTVSFMR